MEARVSDFDLQTVAPYDPEADLWDSFWLAINEIGQRVKAGQPPPTTGYFGPHPCNCPRCQERRNES